MPKDPKETNGKAQKRRLTTLNERFGFDSTSQTEQKPQQSTMITFEVPLKYPDNNIVYFPDLLKEAGVSPPTPPRQNGSGSDSDTNSSDMSDGSHSPSASPSPSTSPTPPPPELSSETDTFFMKILENAELNAMAERNSEKQKKLGKKKSTRGENYDTSDPFIDDSELAPSQRYTGELRPSVDGFFVWKGPLGFEDSDTECYASGSKKASSKRKSTATDSRARKTVKKEDSGNHSTQKRGKKLTPQDLAGQQVVKEVLIDVENKIKAESSKSININRDQTPVNTTPNRNGTIAFIVNPPAPMKEDQGMKTATVVNITTPPPPPPNFKVVPDANKTPGKTIKSYVVEPVHPEVQTYLDEFKLAVSKEPFPLKNKFPQNLKPSLLATIKKAYEHNGFNENLFKILTITLPYNKYTVTRLCKRTLYPIKIPEVEQQRDALIQRLGEELKQIIPSLTQQRSPGSSGANTDGDVEIIGGSSNADGEMTKATVSTEKTKKFKWTDRTKKLLWNIIQMEMDATVMRNDLAEAEDKLDRLSEQTMRKHLYQRLLELWPEGWMSSYEISRMYSAYKRTKNPPVSDKKNAVNGVEKRKPNGDIRSFLGSKESA